jgi:cyclophilin family peptidyl-prolyl cis-trans isomerase
MGPYYAQFVLKFPDQLENDSFVVELPSRKELPHSVFTFLDLADSKLFDETTFLFNDDDNVMRVGGGGQKAAQRFKAQGYGESVLLFNEFSAAYACRKDSVGFLGRGPGLEIYMTDAEAENQDKACFGRVIRGMKTLQRVEANMLKGRVVDIVEVRNLHVDETSPGEL